MIFRSSLLGALLLLAACANPFFIEAKAAALCQHAPAQRFEITPEMRAQFAQLAPTMRQGMGLERTFDFDVSAQLPAEFKEMVELRLSLTSVRLTASHQGENLGFVDEAHLQLLPSAEGNLAVRQFDYVRTQEAPVSVTWNGQGLDLASYLHSENHLRYSVSLVGGLPPGDLVVDLDACAEAEAKANYL